MSVSRAYITSLGTTAILVASSLLVLAVTSAIVAFDGWPGHASAAAVDRVTVKIPPVSAQPVPATTAVTTTRGRTGVTTVAGTPGAGRTAAPAAPTAPLEQPVPGTQDTTRGTAPVSGTTATQRQPAPTSTQDPAPRSGDPVRQATGAVGQSISPVSPVGAQTVVNAGEAVATAIDGVAPVAR
jgi:hypothetical protein